MIIVSVISDSFFDLFGVDWGISGMRPGPTLFNLVTFTTLSIIFVISMLVVMGLFKIIEKRLTNS